MFQGISIQQFNKFFKNEDDCKQYLFDLKWKEGYKCRRCGFTKSYKGKTSFHLSSNIYLSFAFYLGSMARIFGTITIQESLKYK
jgi:Transposase zinc-ribbon domain